MIGQIYHVGITVSDLDKSISFYRDILGFTYLGEIIMEGKETDLLFGKDNCKARVAYLNGSKEKGMPPVELIQFIGEEIEKRESNLFRTSISEICFYTENIEKVYDNFQKKGVECLSKPQDFDFTKSGFGKSKAFYFKDPDGIILEMMQA